MKIFITCGIRPDFINMSLLMKRLEKEHDVIFCHTGQHYDYNLDKIFFDQLKIRQPDYHLGINPNHSFIAQISKVIKKTEPILRKEKPDLCISFSDGNPSMYGITANRLGIKLMHLEAGMRSYDYRMPEEKNRRIIDSISNYLIAPSYPAYKNLLSEGHKNRVIKTGKIILDVIEHHKDSIYNQIIPYDIKPNNYIVAEFHRPENVDNEYNLRTIIEFLHIVNHNTELTIILPCHPRTRYWLKQYQIPTQGIKIIDPIGFFQFEKLQKNAYCVITDSGTSQETCCYYHVRCMVMRMSTERTECIEVNASRISGDSDGTFSIPICNQVFNDVIHLDKSWVIPYKPNPINNIVNFIRDNEDNIKRKKVWWND